MKTIKIGFLAVLLAIPTLGTTLPEQSTETPQILYQGYYKVMPFDGLHEDRFDVYIFGLAQKVEVKNSKGFDIPYNKKVYFKFDSGYKILDIKTEKELKINN